MHTLVSLKKKPYLISGGFDCLIHPVVSQLGIPKEHVFANRLKFYYDGSYAGFDEDQPTSRSGGKSIVIKKLRDEFGHSKIVMIGDGVTDLETYPTADAFIGKIALNKRLFLVAFYSYTCLSEKALAGMSSERQSSRKLRGLSQISANSFTC